LQDVSAIRLKNLKTGKEKVFKIEYVQKTREGYVLKNSNNTIFLKKK
jgi:hypothetical protein